MSAPCREPIGDPADVAEAGGPQQRCGDARPIAGCTDGRDGPVPWQVLEPVLEEARRDMQRGRHVPGGVLGYLADVDDEWRLRAAAVEARRELIDREAAAGLDRSA